MLIVSQRRCRSTTFCRRSAELCAASRCSLPTTSRRWPCFCETVALRLSHFSSPHRRSAALVSAPTRRRRTRPTSSSLLVTTAFRIFSSRHSVIVMLLQDSATMSQWLVTSVGIPNPKAKEIGRILTRAGFDRTTQLVSGSTNSSFNVGLPLRIFTIV